MRLNKFLATAGIASRRKCEELIKNGEIKVNGQVVLNLATTIDEKKDKVEYKGGVTLDDLDDLKGSRMVYLKSAILERMATKELSYLTTVNLEIDAGQVNLEALKEFRDKMAERVNSLKEDIMLYSNG